MKTLSREVESESEDDRPRKKRKLRDARASKQPAPSSRSSSPPVPTRPVLKSSEKSTTNGKGKSPLKATFSDIYDEIPRPPSSSRSIQTPEVHDNPSEIDASKSRSHSSEEEEEEPVKAPPPAARKPFQREEEEEEEEEEPPVAGPSKPKKTYRTRKHFKSKFKSLEFVSDDEGEAAIPANVLDALKAGKGE